MRAGRPRRLLVQCQARKPSALRPEAMSGQGASRVPDKPDYPPIRRIVTGHDAGATARVLIDGAATNWKSSSPGTVSTLIWSTDATPADIAIGEAIADDGARILGTAPPANGTRFAVIDFPPGNSGRMHRTETIDYVVVIAGEIDIALMS